LSNNDSASNSVVNRSRKFPFLPPGKITSIAPERKLRASNPRCPRKSLAGRHSQNKKPGCAQGNRSTMLRTQMFSLMPFNCGRKQQIPRNDQVNFHAACDAS